MGRRAGAAALFASGALFADVQAAQLAPLHVIPTETQATDSISAEAPVRVRLVMENPQPLAQVLGVRVRAGDVSFEYVIDKYPQLRGADGRTWLESTFVIDFTEPAFDPLRKELGVGKSTRAELVAYVARIVEGTDQRDWDFASVVARRRQGDCTEFAVLTAALARMQGLPARVAVGVVLVSAASGHGSFGHAWAEILEDGQWKVADAALLDEPATLRYLPMGVLNDEGMGYALDLVRLMNGWIERLVVLGAAK